MRAGGWRVICDIGVTPMRRLTAFVILTGAVLVSVLGAQGPGTSGRGASASKGLIVGRVVDAASGGADCQRDRLARRRAAHQQHQSAHRREGPVPLPQRADRARSRCARRSAATFRTAGSRGRAASDRRSARISPAATASGGRADCSSRSIWPTASRSPTSSSSSGRAARSTGPYVDEAGEPLVDVFVAAARRSSDGRLLNGPSVRTDDRGAYHFGTLVPGDYVIVVPQMQAAMPAATSDTLASTTNRPLSAKLANSLAPDVHRWDRRRQFVDRRHRVDERQRPVSCPAG